MKISAIVGFALLAIFQSSASVTDVQTLLTKANTLRSHGLAAMFSSDGRFVRNEVKSSMAALRAERLSAQAAGRKPAYCPPEGGHMEMNEIFAALEAVPAAKRATTDDKDAFRAALARKYPCSPH